jgi:putative phosphoesterase
MRIGVVGDIHGNYEALYQAVQRMNHPNLLLFTGDGFRDICRLIEEVEIPIEGVAGNCDVHTEYTNELILKLGKFKVLLTHGHLYNVKNGLTRIGLAGRSKGVNLVVFGHTHMPLDDQWYEVKLFNPGTLCRERSVRGLTYGMIEITDSGIRTSINSLE